MSFVGWAPVALHDKAPEKQGVLEHVARGPPHSESEEVVLLSLLLLPLPDDT
jgi:hypothetical protein